MASPLKGAQLRFTVFVTFNWVTVHWEPVLGILSLDQTFGQHLACIDAHTHTFTRQHGYKAGRIIPALNRVNYHARGLPLH